MTVQPQSIPSGDGADSQPPMLHVVTPLVFSPLLSSITGHNIFVKLETEQRSGSFKMRGISFACWAAKQRLGPNVHIVLASGGNAALAAALACSELQVQCTIFVHNATEKAIVNKLINSGANVRYAEGWEQVNAAAHDFANETPQATYVHPFIGDDVVRGHSTIVNECFEQLPTALSEAGITQEGSQVPSYPDVFCCSVGGGGLVGGIMLGLSKQARRHSLPPIQLIASTPFGADAFTRSLESGHFLEIESDFSRAKSLACKQCSPIAVEQGLLYARTGTVLASQSVATTAPNVAWRYVTTVRYPDSYAGAASWQFGNEYKTHLIEIACGAALVPGFHPQILEEVKKTNFPDCKRPLNVVIVACGGSRVSESDIEEYRSLYGKGQGSILVDGREV